MTTTVSWRVNAERLVLFGWGRAILLQLAHPLVAAGVFEHSGFRSTPLEAARRLSHTVGAMLSLTFGDEVRRERTLDAIRAIHRRVNGTLAESTGVLPAGTRYSAEDPALVLWVHATLIESVLLAHEQLVGPLPQPEHDAYCVEALPIAVALGARPEEIPRTLADVRAYLDRMYASGTIVVGTQARALASAVLSPAGAWPAAPATWINRAITTGLLPPFLREQYGLPWSPSRARTFSRLTTTLRTARRVAPGMVATWKESRIGRL